MILPDGRSVVAFDNASQLLQGLDIDSEAPKLKFQTDRILIPEQKTGGCDIVLSKSGQLVASRIKLRRDRDWRRASFDDVRIGDASTGRQLAKLPFPHQAVFAFAPDERQFAVASDDSIRFWSTATWREQGAIKLPSGPESRGSAVLSLAYSPDGRRIATGHADSTILLWNTIRE